jgi:hypothetical protein
LKNKTSKNITGTTQDWPRRKAEFCKSPRGDDCHGSHIHRNAPIKKLEPKQTECESVQARNLLSIVPHCIIPVIPLTPVFITCIIMCISDYESRFSCSGDKRGFYMTEAVSL